jgi:hypothetical protein
MKRVNGVLGFGSTLGGAALLALASFAGCSGSSSNDDAQTDGSASGGSKSSGGSSSSGGSGATGGSESTGGSDSSGGSGGSDSSGGTGAGASGGSGGAGGEPATGAPIVIKEDCGAPDPCGGTVNGTSWTVEQLCVPEDALRETFETLIGDECPDLAFQEDAGLVTGEVEFGDGALTRSILANVELKVNVPLDCVAGITKCSLLQVAVATQYPGSTCSGDEVACDCELPSTLETIDSVDISFDGDGFTEDGGDREWLYCRDGGDLAYAETTGAEPGIYTFSRN